MDKLNTFFPNGIYVTVGNHSQTYVDGLPMNNMAFDFASGPLIAGWDCTVTRVYKKSPIYDSYFFITLPDGSEIFVLHALPDKTGNFKTGETICTFPLPYPKGPHYHIAIKVNKKWGVLLDYITRHTPLGGKWPFGNWWKYRDLYLNLTKDYIFEVTALRGLNIRKQPTTLSPRIGGISWRSKITVRDSVSGQIVNGNAKWWKYGGGYVSDAYLKPV